MRLLPRCLAQVCLFLVVAVAIPKWAAAAQSSTPTLEPWLFGQAPAVYAQVENPAGAIQQALRYLSLSELQSITAYREFFDSTARRRGMQLLAYLERELNGSWEELVDRLAGRGIAFASEATFDHPFAKPKLVNTLILRGRDAEFTAKALNLLIQIGEQELARNDEELRYDYEDFQGVRIAVLEGQFAVAAVGPNVVVSSQSSGVRAVVTRIKSRRAPPDRVAIARRSLSEPGLFWLWSDLKQVKRGADENFKKLLELPTNEFIPHIIFGGWFDVLRRADELLVSLRTDGEDLVLTTSLPAGQEGMSQVMREVFVCPQEVSGLRTCPEVPGMLFQATFQYQPSGFLRHLDAYVTEQLRADFANFDKQSRLFLLGRSFSQLVDLIGSRHVFIAACQRDTGYRTQPRELLPAFAVILEITDSKKFDEQVLPLIRAAGLIGSLNIPMKLFEEKMGEHRLLGYRFVENDANKQRDHGFLFNFSPTMARLGDQVIFSSTRELASDLVTALESARPQTVVQAGASSSYLLFWNGVGEFLEGIKDQVVSQIVLQDGSNVPEAEKQYLELKKLLARLGRMEASVFYEPARLRLELRTRFAPSVATDR